MFFFKLFLTTFMCSISFSMRYSLFWQSIILIKYSEYLVKVWHIMNELLSLYKFHNIYDTQLLIYLRISANLQITVTRKCRFPWCRGFALTSFLEKLLHLFENLHNSYCTPLTTCVSGQCFTVGHRYSLFFKWEH